MIILTKYQLAPQPGRFAITSGATTEILRPVTCSAISMTSWTENPFPLLSQVRSLHR